MGVLQFLHDNAMQVAGLLTIVINIVLGFTHLTAAQVAALGGLGPGVGIFLSGIVLSRNGNGNGKASNGGTKKEGADA